MSGTKPSSYWSTSHAYPYPWDTVATFYWSRYPNPNSAHVFSEDIIECGVGVDGVLRTKRLIVKTNKLPWWGKHLFSAKVNFNSKVPYRPNYEVKFFRRLFLP